MSYSNQTPYIGFPIRSATDTFNTMDNNEAFEVADTKIKEAHDNAETAATDAAAAVETANEAKTIAEGAAGDIDRIDGTLDEHAERLVILSNRQTSQAAAIKTKAAATSIGNLYDPEDGVYEVGYLVVYDGQLYICTTAVTVPEDFDPNKWDAKDVVSLLPSPGGSIDADDVSFDDTLAQLGATDVQDAIVALKTLIDNIGGNTMKCVKQGKIVPSQALETVDITDLGFTSPLDYVVILSGDGSSQGSSTNTCNALDAKTATSFSVKCDTRGGNVSIYYQILANE